MVMPRAFSSGASSIQSNDRNVIFGLFFASTFVMAAVKVVFPWSTCPIVPMFTCGLLRSNFSLLMVESDSPQSRPSDISVLCVPRDLYVPFLFRHTLNLGDHFFSDILGRLIITLEMHRRSRTALRRRTQVRGVANHLGQRDVGRTPLRATWTGLHLFDLPAPPIQVAVHRAHVLLGRDHFDAHDGLKQYRLRFFE